MGFNTLPRSSRLRLGGKAMGNPKISTLALGAGLFMTLALGSACSLPEPPSKGNAIPVQYANQHMPEDWWGDHSIIEEGSQIYLGNQVANVNCSKCHGKAGRPTKGRARDLSNSGSMKKFSDSHLFWRISEGVPYSTMRGFKDKLSEEEIWKVIAFVSSLGMEGLRYDPTTKGWSPLTQG